MESTSRREEQELETVDLTSSKGATEDVATIAGTNPNCLVAIPGHQSDASLVPTSSVYPACQPGVENCMSNVPGLFNHDLTAYNPMAAATSVYPAQHAAFQPWPAVDYTAQPTFTRGGLYIGEPFDPEPDKHRKRRRHAHNANTFKSVGRTSPPTSGKDQIKDRRSMRQTSDDISSAVCIPSTSAPPVQRGIAATASSALNERGQAYFGEGKVGYVHKQPTITWEHDDGARQRGSRAIKSPGRKTLVHWSKPLHNHSPRAREKQWERYSANDLSSVLRRLDAICVECDHIRTLLAMPSAPASMPTSPLKDAQNSDTAVANAQALKHNSSIKDLDEELNTVVPSAVATSVSMTESLPKTGREIAEMDHGRLDDVLQAFGVASVPGGQHAFLHDKKVSYLRLIGANMELMRKVLD